MHTAVGVALTRKVLLEMLGSSTTKGEPKKCIISIMLVRGVKKSRRLHLLRKVITALYSKKKAGQKGFMTQSVRMSHTAGGRPAVKVRSHSFAGWQTDPARATRDFLHGGAFKTKRNLFLKKLRLNKKSL